LEQLKTSEMKIEKIKSSLCYYDSRNPDGCKDEDVLEDVVIDDENPCYCDNCFKGKTELAEEILKLHREKKKQ